MARQMELRTAFTHPASLASRHLNRSLMSWLGCKCWIQRRKRWFTRVIERSSRVIGWLSRWLDTRGKFIKEQVFLGRCLAFFMALSCWFQEYWDDILQTRHVMYMLDIFSLLRLLNKRFFHRCVELSTLLLRVDFLHQDRFQGQR